MPVEAFAPGATGSTRIRCPPPGRRRRLTSPEPSSLRSVALARAGAVDGAFTEAVAEAVEVAAAAVRVPVVQPGRRGG